jgi:transposase
MRFALTLSERAAARRFGIDPRTVNKMMKFSVPPGYKRKKPPAKPKLDPFISVIDRILRDDKSQPKKQQHTAKRIFERLRDEYRFTGGITIVKDYVAGWRQRTQEMFVPLVHPPGHAQVDFGEAIGIIGGVERKIHFFAFDLPHSDACFVVGYPAETTEAFCDGHVRAFAFFGGVPQSILYDNTKIAVARILGDGKRQRTRVFTELQSHYPIRGSVRPTRQRQRQGQSRGAGRLCAPELPRTNPSVRELRGAERPSAGMLPPSNG